MQYLDDSARYSLSTSLHLNKCTHICAVVGINVNVFFLHLIVDGLILQKLIPYHKDLPKRPDECKSLVIIR